MRRTVITAFACLAACYSPDYTQKPCQDDSGCPVDYACSTEKRCMPGVNSSVTDMGTDPRPKRVEVEVRPSGSFYVGTALTDGINDTPSNLRSNPAPFFLDEREVTVADYRACVTAQVCTAPKTGPFGTQGWICSYGVAGKDQHPVTCVTKTQSEDFCKWMNRRLPTEVEWEYAALGLSGAAPTNQRLVFPVALGGNACWNINATCPVAGYVKTYLGQIVNAEMPGFYDLLGNVWEKTSSPFCTYPAESCTTDKFSLRSASGFDNDVRFSKATARIGEFAEGYYPNQGFRCARDSKP